MPVAYASRSMTKAEKDYASIEKEQLGVVFACERFHVYIYGRKTTVETDYLPLISISKKQLCDAPPRLQRLLMRIQKYDLTLEHTPGKQLVVADTLSRSFSAKEVKNTTESEVYIHVCAVKSNLPVSERKLTELAEATANDQELQRIIRGMEDGGDVCPKPYRAFIEELFIVDGVILKGQRVVVSAIMNAEMLQLIHEGHLVIERCKRRARDILYWPNICLDVYDTVSQCDVCQEYRYAQPQQPLQMHERPDRPWAKVACDIFYLKQVPYLLTVDYYSHYPEIALLTNESSRQVITHLKSLFARYEIPSCCVSDGGPQFASAEFKQFAKDWGIEHKMSSPYYPRSNGLAENAVKVVKRLLGKAADRGEDKYLALLAYRSSPLETGKSPAELLFGRKLRTRLPYRNETFTRKSAPHDRGKSLNVLKPNDTVRAKNARGRRWPERARVVGLRGPRSYDVEAEDGWIMRRNRQHLVATREAFKSYRDEPASQPLRDETQPTAMAAPATANDVDVTNDIGETTEQTSPAKTPTAPRRSERVRTAPVRLGL